MPTIAHHVSLKGAAGVELQFAELVRRAKERHADWNHVLLDPANSIHPLVEQLAGAGIAQRVPTKYWHSLRLPAWPMALRAFRCRHALRRSGVDRVLVWNRSARLGFLLGATEEHELIHYEHGAAWFGGHEHDRREYFGRVGQAIAISAAARAALVQLWDFAGEIVVCRNALRPSLVPDTPEPKAVPTSRPVRLGVAARLFPVKGVSLVVHALSQLRGVLADAELVIAGDGPERRDLEALVARLGLERRVRFRGAVTDMGQFYRDIDCLLHVPVSEAFGLVSIEAAAHGCPVIVAAVDGLPEAVPEEASSICIAPTLPLGEYARLGGRVAGLPAAVYDPATERFVAPRIVDPAALASAVDGLFANASRFETLGRSASAYVAREYSFDRYVDELVSIVGRFSSSRASAAAGR